MTNSNIKTMPHVAERPLSIEREYTMQGCEVVVIEGVRYDADYFRAFAHPDTDVLYAVRREDEMVVLTVIPTVEVAKEFFDQLAGDDAQEEENDGL